MKEIFAFQKVNKIPAIGYAHQDVSDMWKEHPTTKTIKEAKDNDDYGDGHAS